MTVSTPDGKTSPLAGTEAWAPATRPYDIDKAEILRIASVAALCVLSTIGIGRFFGSFDLPAIVGTVFGGLPIYKEAWESLCQKRMTMELSMTIALVAALAIGECLTAALIVLFVLIAEVIEELTMERGERSMTELLELLPQVAEVEKGANFLETPIQLVIPGDTVLVRPGARIPVDGTVISGTSFVDESTITGESALREKVIDSCVYAGTMNQSGALRVQVTNVGNQTAFGKIVEIVQSAESSKAPIQKTADRLAAYLVYFAFSCAIITFIITYDLRSAISVIIVAGACGVAAGTPLAILGAIGQAARIGVIFKGGVHLEQLAKVNLIAFDKTGTITHGKPKVVGIKPQPEYSIEKLLAAAGSAELMSEHPLAHAIRKEALERNIQLNQPEQFHYRPGNGVACLVNGQDIAVGSSSFLKELETSHLELLKSASADTTTVHISIAGDFAGSIDLADSIRQESQNAMRELKQLKIVPYLLTGDSVNVARSVADLVGIEDVRAGLLPVEKTAVIDELKQSGHYVAMVGDGVNDAPALTSANVGIAFGSGTDVAHATADVLLISNNLENLVQSVRMARRCHAVIMCNFFGTILVDCLGIALAACGVLNPLLAALVHVGSELLFICNSARLLPPRDRK